MDITHPGDEIVNNVLGQLPYASLTVRYFDFHGLTEPSIAKLRTAADVYGKYGTPQAAARDAPLLIMKQWHLLAGVVAASRSHYDALDSPKLAEQSVFVAVRDDVASRLGVPLARSFGGHVVPFGDGVAYWRRTAPTGQVAESSRVRTRSTTSASPPRKPTAGHPRQPVGGRAVGNPIEPSVSEAPLASTSTAETQPR